MPTTRTVTSPLTVPYTRSREREWPLTGTCGSAVIVGVNALKRTIGTSVPALSGAVTESVERSSKKRVSGKTGWRNDEGTWRKKP
jgi:hypothetical protein